MTNISNFESRFAKDKLDETRDYRNFVIAESEFFVALPTIGPLVPGWVVIVPKDYTLALAALDERPFSDFTRFEEKVRNYIVSVFGEVVVFEHGPSKPSSKVGCGVDHAHLHIVPIQINLLAAVTEIYPLIKWEAVDNLLAASVHHKAGKSYLYFMQPSIKHQQYIATSLDEFQSQLFRRVIARSIGLPDQWNWKEFPHVSNMEATCSRLSANPSFTR